MECALQKFGTLSVDVCSRSDIVVKRLQGWMRFNGDEFTCGIYLT